MFWLNVLRFFTWSKGFLGSRFGILLGQNSLRIGIIVSIIAAFKGGCDWVVGQLNDVLENAVAIQTGANTLSGDLAGGGWATWLVTWLSWANYGIPIEEIFALAVTVFALYGAALMVRTVLTFVPTIG